MLNVRCSPPKSDRLPVSLRVIALCNHPPALESGFLSPRLTRSMHTMKNIFGLLLCLAVSASAADWPKGIKAPPGWEVTMFAAPTNVGYPTCLSTAPNGDLYVGVDENGSLDAKPNRGRVVRCTDTDGDGKADKFTTFATMDSPRGIWFENNVLYVQHPPFVTAYFDDNGDGVSDRSEAIVKGLGFDLKFRGADHTMNGMRMGIDGFLHRLRRLRRDQRRRPDGTAIKLHGGGVVRVRPDGSGLEIVSHGQRNIYDVAVSPEMDLFTRDNTNDGDGWNVRLSHVLMGGKCGYPSLYKKFGDEMVQPLADYGGGSPCGALFMDEPGFPEGFGRGLYGGVGRQCDHAPSADEQRRELEGGSEQVCRAAASDGFRRGRFGAALHCELAGRDLQLRRAERRLRGARDTAGLEARRVCRFKKAGQAELLKFIGSPSAFARLYAQREILRRDDSSSYVGPLKPRRFHRSDRAPGRRHLHAGSTAGRGRAGRAAPAGEERRSARVRPARAGRQQGRRRRARRAVRQRADRCESARAVAGRDRAGPAGQGGGRVRHFAARGGQRFDGRASRGAKPREAGRGQGLPCGL